MNLKQYIEPRDHLELHHIELLVIDEAAAIPLPLVRSLLGPFMVFLSSTVNGYVVLPIILARASLTISCLFYKNFFCLMHISFVCFDGILLFYLK